MERILWSEKIRKNYTDLWSIGFSSWRMDVASFKTNALLVIGLDWQPVCTRKCTKTAAKDLVRPQSLARHPRKLVSGVSMTKVNAASVYVSKDTTGTTHTDWYPSPQPQPNCTLPIWTGPVDLTKDKPKTPQHPVAWNLSLDSWNAGRNEQDNE